MREYFVMGGYEAIKQKPELEGEPVLFDRGSEVYFVGESADSHLRLRVKVLGTVPMLFPDRPLREAGQRIGKIILDRGSGGGEEYRISLKHEDLPNELLTDTEGNRTVTDAHPLDAYERWRIKKGIIDAFKARIR